MFCIPVYNIAEVIKTFKDKETKKIFEGEFSKKLPEQIQRLAYKKLLRVHAAIKLGDLYFPPSNMLERLRGKKQDYWTIRINKQYRIMFKWQEGNAYEVEIQDTHDQRNKKMQ